MVSSKILLTGECSSLTLRNLQHNVIDYLFKALDFSFLCCPFCCFACSVLCFFSFTPYHTNIQWALRVLIFISLYTTTDSLNITAKPPKTNYLVIDHLFEKLKYATFPQIVIRLTLKYKPSAVKFD